MLEEFSEPTRTWFRAAFAEPTPAQVGAWEAIGAGKHALVVAPTGSGKTLSAFLWSLDKVLTDTPPEDPQERCRVLYVSPLKALAVDVERKGGRVLLAGNVERRFLEQEGVSDTSIGGAHDVLAPTRNRFLTHSFQSRAQLGILPGLTRVEQKVRC